MSEFRTAVLVVHGMGNQRPLETMRGLTEAVWLKGKGRGGDDARYWIHRDRLGDEVDQSVLTTEAAAAGGDRRVDFHELYWAHLMSETRPVAVLLWLFELVRKGPFAKWRALRVAWWAGGLFLALSLLSAVHLPLALVAHIVGFAQGPLVGTVILLVALAAVALVGSRVDRNTARWIGGAIAGSVVLASVQAWGFAWPSDYLPILIVPCLAIVLAFAAMGARGVLLVTLAVASCLAVWGVVAIVTAFLAWLLSWPGPSCPHPGPLGAGSVFFCPTQSHFPWSTRSGSSVWISLTFLILYAVFNALFLQTVLGDAARYFRDAPANVAARRAIRKLAVDKLQALHQCGEYDRIVVIAHSLGTVVAFDMLRTYWGRVAGKIEVTGPLSGAVDKMQKLHDSKLRAKWQTAVSNGRTTDVEVTPFDDPDPKGDPDRKAFCGMVKAARRELDLARRKLQLAMFELYRRATLERREGRTKGQLPDAPEPPPIWLVTDFVTLGSPLTHAPYLMCPGTSPEELAKGFGKRKDERELPTAPPRLDLKARDQEGTLTFVRGDKPRFHHSAVFGVTRWSNLYFSGKWSDPFSVGDPIGGPLCEGFGWAIHDVDVAQVKGARRRRFFEHTSYWSGTNEGHIKALVRATDLPDRLAAQLASRPAPEFDGPADSAQP